MKLKVESKFGGKRLDEFLKEKLGFSASKIKQLLNEKKIKINQKEVWISKFILNNGDFVEVGFVKKDVEKVKIIEENEDFLIVFKPKGVSVENKNYLDSPVINELQKINSKKYNYNNLGLVHRLDKDTAGLLILARNDDAFAQFLEMFKNREVQKTYHATVWGVPKKKDGEIRRNIERDWSQKNKVKICQEGGREAITEYKVLHFDGKKSLIKCRPKTGRMHQIRVHLASLGTPILGDKIYGNGDGLDLHLKAVGLKFKFKNKTYNFSLPD